MNINVLVASYLESVHIERIRAVSPRVRVFYDQNLVAPPRYVSDHNGEDGFRRGTSEEKQFRSWLFKATVMFDFDRPLAAELPVLAPNLRWIQATSSGIGPFVQNAGLDSSQITITNAAGIHAVPLAEHVLLSLLYFVKDIPARLQDQRAHRWERYCGRELRGLTVGVIGLGAVGLEVSRLVRAAGLKVIGVKRTPAEPSTLPVDELYLQDQLHEILPRCDALVLICPHTPETEGMLGADEFELMKPGSLVVNIGRGALIQEEALIDALDSGQIGGAALDVTTVEPLPASSPLWDMPNVLITAHSASTVDRENERLLDLFCENLKRFENGDRLLNVFSRPFSGDQAHP